MRLLRTCTGPHQNLELLTFNRGIPNYAILSHVWNEDEVVFEHIQDGTAREHAESYHKITNAIQQAAADGHEYIWIDSCCIDKSSSAELQEAINSMYAWYQQAEICYAILEDVPGLNSPNFASRFQQSKWFTRGWTLQELLAPRYLRLFGHSCGQTKAWTLLGSRDELCLLLSLSTSIDEQYLSGDRGVHEASVVERMSWAAKRITTREEDVAYSLLGLFSVNMPMLYGEGPKAFMRLQEEIMKVSDDQSIFAWTQSQTADNARCNFEAINHDLQIGELRPNGGSLGLDSEASFEPCARYGLLADSPAAFLHSGEVTPLRDFENNQAPYQMTNRGLSVSLNLTPLSQHPAESRFVADINCHLGRYWGDYNCDIDVNTIPIGIYLLKLRPQSNLYARLRCDRLVTLERYMPHNAELTKLYVRQNNAKPPDSFCLSPSWSWRPDAIGNN